MTKFVLRKGLKIMLFALVLPLLYFVVAMLLTWISVNPKPYQNHVLDKVYLNTNGVHLDVVLPVEKLSPKLAAQLSIPKGFAFVSFGWGDENFYLNTEQWEDLTLSNAATALFWKSSTLVHLNKYQQKQQHWVPVSIHPEQMDKLNSFIAKQFHTTESGQFELLPGMGYGRTDSFYKAKGSYSCLYTCNTWVNEGFKESGLRACLWTPFDFGLLGKYNKGQVR